MIKLVYGINKSALIRRAKEDADEGYRNSWEREYAKKCFLEGVCWLLEIIQDKGYNNEP